MDKYVCHACIDDIFIKQKIRLEGSLQKCFYCKKKRKTVNLSTLAGWIDPVYRENYIRREEYPVSYGDSDHISYETTGDSPDDIISEMLEVDSEISYDIVEVLSEKESYEVIKEAQPALYDHTSTYDATYVSSYRHLELWYEFCHIVKHESRFYNVKTTQILDSIFSKIDSLKYIGERPPIRSIGPGTGNPFIYRARHVKNDDEIIKIKLESYKELGPPPKSKATPGRMNAQGIPVFYGATDSETCVAEIRLPVGGKAVLAKFEIIKPIVVLDLTVFSEMYEVLSMFDPEFEYKASRLQFLRDFDRRISEPVLSHENSFDYIPTQALAEYLANHYERKIDAVIYSSTQVEGELKNNIVILPHAATVEWSSEVPEHDSLNPYRLLWSEDSYFIFKTKPGDENKMISLDSETIFDDYNISSTPTLRIVNDSIKVIQAKSISYGIKSYETHYWEV